MIPGSTWPRWRSVSPVTMPRLSRWNSMTAPTAAFSTRSTPMTSAGIAACRFRRVRLRRQQRLRFRKGLSPFPTGTRVRRVEVGSRGHQDAHSPLKGCDRQLAAFETVLRPLAFGAPAIRTSEQSPRPTTASLSAQRARFRSLCWAHADELLAAGTAAQPLIRHVLSGCGCNW